ncbi:hypothetical protein PAECIP111893_02372 [Paenibacillus plantiphilus]|uniref:Large polyvalent protein associated domain-containing protein n=1 Tax=Paenibacillus plantiphilus TaxID=2905650 RepID=A0ABM9C8Y6_9BACL|nr:hypothetical protein [Paenibacillus plantiphilus]CAH1205570.1 hypothetical protein PAECIP111893_02372 [Paenibacillus plantiphilus]
MSKYDGIRKNRREQGAAARERVLSGKYSQPEASSPSSTSKYDSIRNRSSDTNKPKEEPVKPQIELRTPDVAYDKGKQITGNMLQQSIDSVNAGQKAVANAQNITGNMFNSALKNANITSPPVQGGVKPQTADEWMEEQHKRRMESTEGPGVMNWIGRNIAEPLIQGIDWVQAKTPGLSAFQQGAGDALGVQTSTAPVQDGLASTIGGFAGNIAGYATNPAQLEASLFTGGYKVADSMLGSKAGQKLLGSSQRGASNLSPALNAAGINIGRATSDKLVNNAFRGGIAGAVQNTANSAIRGETDIDQLGKAALIGGAFGAPGDMALGALGGAFKGVANRLDNTARTLTETNPIFKTMVSDMGENHAKAQLGRQWLNDLDNQMNSLRSMDTAPLNPSARANMVEQMKGLQGQRNATIEYIKQYDPSFTTTAQGSVIPSQLQRGTLGGRQPLVTSNVKPAADGEILPPQAQTGPRVDVTPNQPPVNAIRGTGQAAVQGGQPLRGLRSNYQNQLNNGNFSEGLQRRIRTTDQRYDIARNADTVSKANENMKNMTKAEADFHFNQSGGPDHIATGYRLLHELDALGEHQRALNVADKLAKDLTNAGQTSQAASLLSRLSPEGQLLHLTRTAAKNGKEVTVADSVKFKELAAKVQENSGAGVRSNQFTEILNKLERGDNVTSAEIQQLGRFLEGAKKLRNPKVKPVDEILPPELKDPRKRDKIVSYLDEKEQAALARIAARKNQLNAVPVGEWADHAIVVASQMVKGTIKAADHVETIVKVFGESVRPHATEIFKQAQKIYKGTSKNISEDKLIQADESFRRMTGQKATLQEKIVEKYIKDNPVRPNDIKKLRQLAKDVTDLQGMNATKADMQMQKILNSYEKSSLWDKVNAIRYIAMLLNSTTQSINTLSGPLMATTNLASDVLPAMIDRAMHTVFKTKRNVTLYGSNPLRFIWRWMKSAPTGAYGGWHGVNPAGIAGPNEIRGLTYKSLYNPLGLAERTLGAVAKGADYATYSAVRQSEIHKMGYLDAINNGVKGRENIKRHVERFVNDPPEEALLQADRIGKNTTFQRNDTLGGKTAQWLNSSPKAINPIARTVFPFVRTPMNIASTAVTMSPGGIIKGLYQLTSKSDATRREAIRTLSLGLMSTGVMSPLGYYMFNTGIITDANDSGDKDLDAIREQAGRGKYRFNTSALGRYLDAFFTDGVDAAEKAAKYQQGDNQFDYNKLQPVAFPFAMGAGLASNKDKGTEGALIGAGSDAFGSLLGMSSVRGLQEAFQPQYGGTQGEKAVGIPMRLAESFFKSFSPSLLAQEARRQDPTMRKVPYNDGFVNDVKGYFMNRIPGLSQQLPPLKTTLGQDRKNPSGVVGQYLNPYKSDVAPYTEAAAFIADLIDRTGDTGLAPKPPEKTVEGRTRQGDVKISIPPDRYAKLQEDIGNEVIEQIGKIPKELDDLRKADMVKKIYAITKKKHTDRLKHEYGIRVTR